MNDCEFRNTPDTPKCRQQEVTESDESIFKAITEHMYNTYIRKHHDYGNSTSETFDKFGPVSYVVRMHDKLSRIETLMNTVALVTDEKIQDTLLDLANYCILFIMDMERQKCSAKMPKN